MWQYRTFGEVFQASVASPYNLVYALVIVLFLSDLRGLPQRGLHKMAPTLALRYAEALGIVWILGTISDYIFPNTITWTILPAVACMLLFRDWKLPMRLARMALLVSSWMYSISIAEIVHLDISRGLAGAPFVSFIYMIAMLLLILLLERDAAISDFEESYTLAAPVLVVCASGLAGRAILILRSDFGMEPYSNRTLESLLTCINGEVAAMMVYGVAMHLANEFRHNRHLAEEQRLMEVQVEGLRVYRESAESFHELRHEVKNQYAYIKMLLEQKDYDRAEEFFGEMSMSANPTFAYVATGNQLVDDIVNLELSRARAKGIEVSTKIAVPTELPFSETDLCSLISNLLDNAIEACEKTGEGPIQFGMMADKDQGVLIVTVSNPSPTPPKLDKDGRLLTTKQNRSSHGYGTRVVRRIAENNGGVADFSYEDGTFTARVMLSLSN